MGVLDDYQLQHGLSDAGLAALLSERIPGRKERNREPIKATGVQAMKRRHDSKLPASWLEALGIEPQLPSSPDTSSLPPLDDGGEPLSGRRREESPPSRDVAPPPRQELLPPVDWAAAREALIGIYQSIGMGVARLRRDPEMATIFTNAAPILADDWIAFAKVNEGAARLLRTLTYTGAGGKLAFDHVMLLYAIMTRKRPDGSADVPRADNFVHVPGPPSGGNGGGYGAEGAVDEAATASGG